MKKSYERDSATHIGPRPHPLEPHAASHHPLAAYAYHLPSLSSTPHGRPHLRQEPDAVVPLVRICGRGCERSRFLLRLCAGSRFGPRTVLLAFLFVGAD